MKVGQIYYSKQKNSEWLVWHEVTAIEGDTITIAHYGKDTDSFESKFTKKEIQYSIKKGLLISA